jgi:hypothetical protein
MRLIHIGKIFHFDSFTATVHAKSALRGLGRCPRFLQDLRNDRYKVSSYVTYDNFTSAGFLSCIKHVFQLRL